MWKKTFRWIIGPIGFIIGMVFLYQDYLRMENRDIMAAMEYEWADTLSFSGTVIAHRRSQVVGRGTAELELHNGVKVSAFSSNYVNPTLKKGFVFDFFIQKGDSISKKLHSDTIFVYRGKDFEEVYPFIFKKANNN